MKVSIGTNIKDGPWGGGNLFAINLKNHLHSKGFQVVNNLDDDDIDIILITEPRRTSESSAFTHIDVQKYLKFINRETLVMHRINECDERKNTKYLNKYMMNANKVADYTVFVSTWLKNLYENQGIGTKNNHVILAGANKEIFNNENYIPWDGSEEMRIVTHHWGANWNKGFDIYVELDKLISSKKWKNKISFTYIGNLPKNFKFENTKVIMPLSGKNLAEAIKKNHIYLTASINEPSGNHHIEGAQCGLPLLYINSGGIPEYCSGFGEIFDKYNFEQKLEKLMYEYLKSVENMKNYPNNSIIMCTEFENLFIEMLENKEKLLDQRDQNIKIGILESFLYKLKRRTKVM
tara:strand:- start:65 stop:1111 length:1047 start_codon:yes stop_codon:yes gene_type:complete